jgi:hypothetical protein
VPTAAINGRPSVLSWVVDGEQAGRRSFTPEQRRETIGVGYSSRLSRKALTLRESEREALRGRERDAIRMISGGC